VTLSPSLRRQAFLEFASAKRWYEKQRAGLGAQFESEVDRAIADACATPQRFAEAAANVRYVRVHRFPFLIYYRVRGNTLIVLAVYHTRRNPAIWRSRD
jgi:plasmid stabilization system protein ParE